MNPDQSLSSDEVVDIFHALKFEDGMTGGEFLKQLEAMEADPKYYRVTLLNTDFRRLIALSRRFDLRPKNEEPVSIDYFLFLELIDEGKQFVGAILARKLTK